MILKNWIDPRCGKWAARIKRDSPPEKIYLPLGGVQSTKWFLIVTINPSIHRWPFGIYHCEKKHSSIFNFTSLLLLQNEKIKNWAIVNQPINLMLELMSLRLTLLLCKCMHRTVLVWPYSVWTQEPDSAFHTFKVLKLEILLYILYFRVFKRGVEYSTES